MLYYVSAIILILSGYSLLRPKGPEGLPDRIEALPDKHDTNLPWWLAWMRKKASNQRTELLIKIHAEQAAISAMIAHEAQMAKIHAENRYMPTRMANAHALESSVHQVNMNVAQKALENDTDIPGIIEIRKKQEFEKLEIERRWKEIEQDLRSSFIFAQKEYQYLQMFREYLNGLYEDRQRIRSSNDPAKDDKLRLLNSHIESMEQDFGEQQKRLLQASQRQNLLPGDEDSERP
jgi:hypothetical protein